MEKVLVVVDMQKDFCDGALGFEKATTLEKGIYEKIEKYIGDGYEILFTKDTHYEDYLETREGKNLPIEHCIYGTKGHEMYGRLGRFATFDNVILKESFGSVLDNRRFEYDEFVEIELVGLVTNLCVLSNVIVFQSFNPNATIIIDASLCASYDEDLHEKALDIMSGLQMKVINRESY